MSRLRTANSQESALSTGRVLAAPFEFGKAKGFNCIQLALRRDLSVFGVRARQSADDHLEVK